MRMTLKSRAWARPIRKYGVSIIGYLEMSSSLWKLRFFFWKALDIG